MSMPIIKKHQQQVDDMELILTGPFGDVMDVSKMIPLDQVHKIEEYDESIVLSKLQYVGNPLADAQIALYLHGEYLNDGRNYAYSSYISQYFLEWAVRGMVFPECAILVGDRDVMHHPNKGIIGIRMDGIEGVEMKNVSITNFRNKSPLSQCSECETHLDSSLGDTNVRGISMYDSELVIFAENKINNMDSYYGTSLGLDIMDAYSFYTAEHGATLDVSDLKSNSKVEDNLHAQYDPFIILGIVGLIILIVLICIGTYCCSKERQKIENKLSMTIHRDSIMAYTPRSSAIPLSPSGGTYNSEFTYGC